MKPVKGGILAAKSFSAGVAAAGIKSADKPDVALIWSEVPAVTAAVFTQNSVLAAPVQLSKRNCRDHNVCAIVVNSGNANCMTGDEGKRNADEMVRLSAESLGFGESEILVASTGIIGRPLPMEKIRAGIKAAYDDEKSTTGDDVAAAIMTTDTHSKSVAYTCTIGGTQVVIGGCAKGSGMIEPNMATLLSFLTTDAAITPLLLNKALRDAVRTTFNCITVDGCMSTNDTLSITANGQAGNPTIATEGPDYEAFLTTLRQVCKDLALMIVRDGEGASMLVTVEVQGAKDYDQAKSIGYAIANSPLVKTATRAKTGNWGRIAQAAGTLGLPLTEDSMDIKVTEPAPDELKITVAIRLGSASATVYTCDLSKEYIDINVEYN